MAQLMLINPAKRPSKRRKATRSPAQKAATRRMLAANRTRKAPATRRRRRNPVSALSTVHTRRARRRARNPIAMGGIMSSLTDAAIGAGGALAVDMAFNFLPLPATLKTGMAGTAAKAATAIAIGTLGRKVLGRTAGKMAAGALTVIAYDALKAYVPGVATVAGLGYMSPGLPAGYLPQQGVGEYVQSRNMAGVAEYIYR